MSDRIDAAHQSARDAVFAKHGETVAISTEGLLDLMVVLADATRSALAAKAEGEDVMAGMFYGAIDGILVALAALGLPSPARSARELLDHAEEVLALAAVDPDAVEAKYLAQVEGAVDPNIG